MSDAIQKHAVESLWTHWTAVGVAGVARPPREAIDLEAMIAFTPFVAAADPRLADESLDWCLRIGKSFISISRLRQLVRLMPPRARDGAPDIAAMLLAKLGSRDQPHRLSSKSRSPNLESPCLLQLRSRYIFGVGARADIMAMLGIVKIRPGVIVRGADLRPTGYTKQAVATVLDELASAGVLRKQEGRRTRQYAILRNQIVRALLAPLPIWAPPWAERFAIIAHVLEAWRKYGKRATYNVELAKALAQIAPTIAAAGVAAPRNHSPAVIEGWVLELLGDGRDARSR